MVKCWLMSEAIADQKAECHRKPEEFVSLKELERLGVLYFSVPIEHWEQGLEEISKQRGYNYRDEIFVNRDKLPNYDEKIKNFFQEHLHTDEEIRFIRDGEGYFDVRNEKEEWVRMFCEPGDLIILPAGIYHRFTVTTQDYIHAVRLFKGEPVWTPYNRGELTDTMPARISYLSGGIPL